MSASSPEEEIASIWLTERSSSVQLDIGHNEICVKFFFNTTTSSPYTSSADSPFSLMSSFTLSNHLLLVLPLFLLPCTFITIALLPT